MLHFPFPFCRCGAIVECKYISPVLLIFLAITAERVTGTV